MSPTRAGSLLLAVVLLGCSGDSNPAARAGDAGDTGGATDAFHDTDAAVGVPNPDCDPLVEAQCAMPWPSNLYLEPDSTRATGFTLAFGPTSLPANFRGVHIAPDDYRRLDGYGVSTPILVQLPNLDVSALADDATVARSMAADAPIRLFRVDGTTLVRVPYFVDLDAWEPDPALKTLYVRPAVILDEGTRYVVAFLSDLRDTTGTAYEPSPAFARLVSGDTVGDPRLAGRQARFDGTFDLLAGADIERDELLLAWDFVTASSDALHGRMLEMRREGLEAAGASGPELVITEWVDRTPEQDPYWASLVRGHIVVPHFMREDVATDPTGTVTGWTFNQQTDGQGLVQQNGTREAEFWIGIPHSASDGTPHGLMQHGHGFFGLGEDATGAWTAHGQICNEANLIVFGGDWTGMSEHDFGNIQFAVFELTHFRWLTDRSHQGLLEFILLARSMRERFADLPEVGERGIVIDPERLYYEGISQGGIYGATYMALTPDIERGHLAVPGQNYALLTHRSENFDQFFVALAGAYPTRSRQAVLLGALQTLWDTIDPASYYRHIFADPFEDDSPRQVLLTPSLGDYSVTEISIDIVARTLGEQLPVLSPIANDVAEIDLASLTEYPVTGSGIVYYSWPGLRRIPGVNMPAPRGERDPHVDQRWLPAQQAQMIHFWDTGEIIDTCGGDGCTPE